MPCPSWNVRGMVDGLNLPALLAKVATDDASSDVSLRGRTGMFGDVPLARVRGRRADAPPRATTGTTQQTTLTHFQEQRIDKTS